MTIAQEGTLGSEVLYLFNNKSLKPIKCLFSFSTAQTEKNSWKKMGKTKLVVWWIDVTNKIQDCTEQNS